MYNQEKEKKKLNFFLAEKLISFLYYLFAEKIIR